MVELRLILMRGYLTSGSVSAKRPVVALFGCDRVPSFASVSEAMELVAVGAILVVHHFNVHRSVLCIGQSIGSYTRHYRTLYR